MSDIELLDEIAETAFDPGLKATAIRDRIRDILFDAGFATDDADAEEPEED